MDQTTETMPNAAVPAVVRDDSGSKAIKENNSEETRKSCRKDIFVLKEKVPLDRAARVLRSSVIASHQYHSLNAVISIATKGGGFIDVEYSIEEGRYGRLKSQVISRKPGFIYHSTTMVREMRNAIFAHEYHDVDMQNAHMNFATQLFSRHDIPHPQLKAFIVERKSLITQISKELQIDEGEVKNLFIALSYGGGFNTWCEKVKRTDKQLYTACQPFDIRAFKTEYKEAVYTLIKKSEYKKIISFTNQRRKEKLAAKQPINSDLYFSAMAYLLQDVERVTIIALMTHLNEQNRLVSGYAYDGLMVQKLYEDEVISDDQLASWNTAVREATGYTISLSVKPMEVLDQWLPPTIDIRDDEDGAQHFLSAFGSRLKMCSNRLFVKLDTGIWSCDDKIVQNTLIGMSMSLDLYMNKRPYSKNVDGAKRMITTVKAIIKPDPDFVANLWSSNIGYIVYRDGVYDVRRKCKVSPQETHDIASTILINRDIPVRNETLMAEVEEKVWSRLLPREDERAYCKTLLARGLAGEIQDKRYGVFRGDRNCGKGVTTLALQAAFGAYIGSTNSENFMYKGRSAPVVDQAKSQSWMLAHEFTRLAISQEIHIEESDPHPSKINGNMIKRFASGGDVLQARLNYKDETDFKVQARLIMFMNDLPKFSPADAMETMDYIDFPNRFVSAQDKAVSPNVDDPTVFIADNDIKSWLTRSDVVDAFAWTVLDAYSTTPLVPDSVRCGKEELMDGLRETDQLDDLFEITKVATDRLTNEQVERHSRGINMSALRKKKYLIRRGAFPFRENARRGLAGLKMKTSHLEPSDDD